MDIEFIISEHDIKSKNDRTFESVFSLANGHIGTRGSFDYDINSKRLDIDEGTFINAFYESKPIIYGELAYGYAENHQTIQRVINPKQIVIKKQGEIVDFQSKKRYLDMKNGVLYHNYELIFNGECIGEVESKRLVSMYDHRYMAISYNIEIYDTFEDISIETHFTREKERIEIDNKDPRRKIVDLSNVNYNKIKDNVWQLHTQNSKLNIICAKEIQTKTLEKLGVYETNFGDISRYSLKTSKVRIDEVYYYSDIFTDEEEYKTYSIKYTFQELYSQQINYYNNFWKKSDIILSGDEELQKNIRFNIFQLNQSAGRDGKSNIAAKGLSGDGYEGHYFWDTEMYMLPFFIYTQSDVAKSLLIYRYSILDNARQRAKTMGINKGALFPWRTINGEECSAYYPAGTAQFHINADIANAVKQYYLITKDKQFMINYGLEILLETARFWLEFGSYINGKFEIHCVTGPDEYTTLVDNNFYTNKMAQNNLIFASKYLRQFQNESKVQDMLKKINFEINEVKEFEKSAEKMYFAEDNNFSFTLQDSSSHHKKIWPFSKTEKSKYPLLLHFHPLNIYKHRVNKQADTIFALFLFKEQFEQEQLKIDYEYYKTITTHDSSLSKSVFSMMASHIDLTEEAYTLFMDTVHMDLHDEQGNTIDGLHAANMGGMWVSLINGFAGISILEDRIIIDPKLPQKWNNMKFNIFYQNNEISIEIKKDILSLENKGIDTIQIQNKANKYKLKPGHLQISL